MTSERSRGEQRYNPKWWDHQRHVLVALKRAIVRSVERMMLAPTATVVDLGCGDRPYEQLIRKVAGNYIACDLEGEVDCRLVPGNRSSLPDGSADAVVSFQVLEHVWELDWYLSEARRLVKAGGSLLLSTHGTWLYHPHPGDYRRWTREGLVREIERFGFRVTDVDAIVGPLAWTTQIRLLGIRHVLMTLPLVGRALTALVAAAMNLRMVFEDAITPTSIRDTNACIYLIRAQALAASPPSPGSAR